MSIRSATLLAGAAAMLAELAPFGLMNRGSSGYHRFARNSFLAARRQGRRRAHRNRRKAARS